MKTAKKLVVLMVVLAMVFALNVPAFALEDSELVNVTFLIPKSYSYENSQGITVNVNIPAPTGYTTYAANTDYWVYSVTGLDLAEIDFMDEEQDCASVFDVFYAVADGIRHETSQQFVYAYDSAPVYGNPGWYISKLSGQAETELSSSSNYWAGVAWIMFDVPNGVSYDVTHPVMPTGSYSYNYALSVYASNVAAQANHTYYMVYKLDTYSW